jgi:hypothetical protein
MMALTSVFFAGCVTECSEAINEASWYKDSKQDVPWENEIPQQCVFAVPSQNVNETVSMLEKESAVLLSLEKATEILAVDKLEPDALLEEAAKIDDAEAEKRENESKIDAFAGETAEKMKKWASEDRQTAAKYRCLKGRTKPYLCRGLMMGENTDCFTAVMKNSNLWITHISPGRNTTPMKQQPVIVFLPKKPRTVYVTAFIFE